MYDHLPLGGNYGYVLSAWILWLSESRLLTRVSELEKLRQRKMFKEDNLRYLSEQSHSCAESSFAVVESESLKVRRHQSEEGCDLLRGTLSFGDKLIPSQTEDTPEGWEEVASWQ